MGFISKFNQSEKKRNVLILQEFENRAKAFNKEYDELTKKYKCVHQAILDIGNMGITPKSVVIDTTDFIKKDD